MATDVLMPQMGESIAEGTIVKWLKKVGDKVAKDEPLFEISTDKVDAEIPSTVDGVLIEILTVEGETIGVNLPVARIGAAGESAAAPAPAVAAPAPPPAPVSVPAPPAPVVAAGPAIDVIMPQMGESIAEGTIVKWLKKVGDKIAKDEPLFEISTDKVDAEIPSTTDGVLLEILAKEGETIGVNLPVARIGAPGAAPAASAPTGSAPAPVASASVIAPAPAAPAAVNGQAAPPAPAAAGSIEELRRTKSSPVVRKIAKEHGVNIAELTGSGISGRVTKTDILGFIDQRKSQPAAVPAAPVAVPAAPAAVPAAPVAPPAPRMFAAGERTKVEPMSVMRKKIAEHMTNSQRTSAHVATFFEVDFTNIARLRDRIKDDFKARNGVNITFLPFIIKSVSDAIRAIPILNSSVDGDTVVYKQDINIGVAVALDWGLIVPVVKHADELNLLGLARATQDLASRARNKQLKPDEVSGGTFSITNFGLYGGLTATPIINQPQVAIMGIGGIHKRPWVVETPEGDAIAIRHIGILSLSFDHRIIDGAVADQFLATVKKSLETTDFSALV
ncbi:MAG: 2-oxoglutarate dehydrogenase, E2 component, dihydrolipoamide succinyltransferase [Blastocatellia bacterium]